MHNICIAYAYNMHKICFNMQLICNYYAINMHKYAIGKYAEICKKMHIYAKYMQKICRTLD